jgi:hypothetical protein
MALKHEVSDKDLDGLEAQITALAEAAQVEKHKHAERLREYRVQVQAIQGYLERMTTWTQKLYERINNDLDEAER